jgi:5'(3')-deoxyribonucleotidase
MNEGLRYDGGKISHDLLPAHAINELAKVLTFGAKKYAPNNWMKGMKWSRIIGPMKRHLNAIERGEDYDPETGLLHAAHVMCNAAFLTEYYKIHPQGDDRPAFVKPKPRVGIDIDDVLADFLTKYCERYELEKPSAWMFDNKWSERYEEIINDPHFYLSLKPIILPSELPFEPTVYITSRDERLREKTERWLFDIWGYPQAPVVFTKDKLPEAWKYELDIFIDDKYDTFHRLNHNGMFCYLFDASHNQRYSVGHRRINKETIKNIL